MFAVPDSDLAGSLTHNQLKRKRKGVESLLRELCMDEALVPLTDKVEAIEKQATESSYIDYISFELFQSFHVQKQCGGLSPWPWLSLTL